MSNKELLDKLGNTFIYLIDHCHGAMSKTKLLKLIYFIEEESVKKRSIPMFGLSFEVWQAGPVAKELYVEFNNELPVFDHYISISTDQTKRGMNFEVKTAFCDDEFSEDDIELLDTVVELYGHKTATQLVKKTHSKTSLWYKIADVKNLLKDFQSHTKNSSDYKIDFLDLLDSEDKKEFYNEHLEFLNA